MSRKYDLGGLYIVTIGIILFSITELVAILDTGYGFSVFTQCFVLFSVAVILVGMLRLANYNVWFSRSKVALAGTFIFAVINIVFVALKQTRFTEIMCILAIITTLILICLYMTAVLLILKGCCEVLENDSNQKLLCEKSWKLYLFLGAIAIVIGFLGGLLANISTGLFLVTVFFSGIVMLGINIIIAIRIFETYKKTAM